MQSNYSPSSLSMMEVPHHYQFRIIVIGDTMVGKSSLLKTFFEGVFSDSEPTVGVDFFSKMIEIRNPHSNHHHNSPSAHNHHNSSPSQSTSSSKDISSPKLVSNQSNIKIKLQIWDTAGQERFRSIVTSYYRNSAGIILVYDITNRESYDHLVDWLFEARRFVESPMTPSSSTPSRHNNVPPSFNKPSNDNSNLNVQNNDDRYKLDKNINQNHHNNNHQKPQENNKSKIVYLVIGCKTDLEAQRQVSFEDGQAFANLYGLQFIETSSKARHNVNQAFQLLAEEIYDRISDSGRLVVGNGNMALDGYSRVPIDGVRLGPLVDESSNMRSDLSYIGGNRSRILEAQPVSGFMGGCC